MSWWINLLKVFHFDNNVKTININLKQSNLFDGSAKHKYINAILSL